jgi:CDP-diacylglycerol---glycerol-3-phosphate 3-phosphatidyltransferase
MAKSVPLGSVYNVPNLLTISRLVLSVVCFVALTGKWYLPALTLFIIAAGTDWLDGYWARKYGQVTLIGRVLDPFADKIIVCGGFIFLAAEPGSQVTAWMAVLVVARELLVTALRSFIESSGGDFSAKSIGKWKMVLQCVAIGLSIFYLWRGALASDSFWRHATQIAVWVAVALTLYSGWVYVQRALAMAKERGRTA